MPSCTSAQEGYGKTADHVNCVIHHALPFTGLDVTLVIIVALALIALGVTLRSRTV